MEDSNTKEFLTVEVKFYRMYSIMEQIKYSMVGENLWNYLI